jgi:hypothetical protein
MKPPFSLETLVKRYQDRRPAIVAYYHQMIAVAEELAVPRQEQRILPAEDLPELAAYLPGAQQIMLGVCTIGPALERRVEQLFAVDPVEAVILDEIGTYWVKAIARQMHDEVRERAHVAGVQASPSYRPGIGQWPLSLHQLILSNVDTAAIDLRLVGDMLLPQKTISMIVALGRSLGRSKYAREHYHAAVC